MHPTTWKASGHVDAFSDPLIDNKDSKKRYRADVLIEDHAEKLENKAQKEIKWLFDKNIENPMIEQLNIEFLIKKGDINLAYEAINKALKKYPKYRAFVYELANYLIQKNLVNDAIKFLQNYLLIHKNDPELYKLLAKAYSLNGNQLLQYESLSQSFYYRYNLEEAITQMDMAVRARDGNFYEKSRVEARLKQLQREKEIYEISKANL